MSIASQLPIGLTADDHARRRTAIGASEISTIFGLNPYRTGEEMRLEKLGRIEPGAQSDAARLGNVLEAGVLLLAECELHVDTVRGEVFRASEAPLAATLDARIVGTNDVIDAKTTGLTGLVRDHWGPAGTDEVPLPYVFQVQAQLACTGGECGYIAALIGGRGFVLYRIERDNDIVDHVLLHARLWWDRHVIGDEPCPDQATLSPDVLKRMRRTPSKIAAVASATAREYLAACEAAAKANEAKEAAQAKLLSELGDAEAGQVDGESGLWTYYEQQRKGYTVKPSKFRQLKFTKG